MAGKDSSRSPITGFWSSPSRRPVRSKGYRRPSPLKQRLQTSVDTAASASESFPQDNQPCSKSTTDVSDTSVAMSKGEMTRDTVFSTSQSHERLRPGEIRLLRIFPSGPDLESIEGSLETFALGASPRYTAISYAWGDRKDISTIRIDGQATPITTSLWHALMGLRKRHQPVWVWADALSINQRDIDELNTQVQFMDSIYHQARSVAICLGPQSENDDSKLAFEFMESNAKWKPSNVFCSILTENPRRISSVVRLFERNYWKRLWVMQEVFHARKADVYCGSDCLALDTIFSACKAFESFSDDIEKLFPAGKVAQASEDHYSYAQALTTQGPNSLLPPFTRLRDEPSSLDILRICRTKLIARPQDKILGALSLLPRDIRSMFQPDFHLTTQEVFTEIVVCVIKSSRRLDVICESIRYPFHQNSLGLPSWVPDWSYSPDTLSLAATHLSHRRPFQACPPEVTLEISTTQPVFSGDELRISGIQIGTIAARGMAVGTLGRLSDYLMAFLEWRHLLHDDKHYTRSDTAAFCRTLCLGDVPEDVYPTLNRQYDLIGPLEDSFWVEEESPDTGLRKMDQWQQATFDLFAHFLEERLGRLPLDEELQSHQKKGLRFQRGRQFLQDYFGDHMMGRCFCLIESEDDKRYMGMGTGYMGVDDLVVIADGCSTPIIIRPTDQEGKYEFIGDIYVDGCMDGRLSQFLGTKRKFVLR